MKILKQGNLPTIQKTCGYCECVFEFDRTDLEVWRYDDNTTYQVAISCPECQRQIFIDGDDLYKLNLTYDEL